MPFLLAEILNFQGSTHLIGVGSLRYLFIHFVHFFPGSICSLYFCVRINLFHPLIIKMLIQKGFQGVIRFRMSQPVVVPVKGKGRHDHIHCKEHHCAPGNDLSRFHRDLFNPAGKSGIQDLDPDHCGDPPEKAVKEIDPSSQVKGDLAVIPEYRPEDPFGKHAAGIFIKAAQHCSIKENVPVALVSVTV